MTISRTETIRCDACGKIEDMNGCADWIAISTTTHGELHLCPACSEDTRKTLSLPVIDDD